MCYWVSCILLLFTYVVNLRLVEINLKLETLSLIACQHIYMRSGSVALSTRGTNLFYRPDLFGLHILMISAHVDYSK